MPLSLKPQALTHLLKSCLHLPTPYKPGDDPLGSGVEIGAQQSLGLELLLGIADQDPTQRNGWQPRAVPDRRGRSHLDGALPAAIPVSDLGRLPNGLWVFSHRREVGQTLTF